MPEPNFLAYLMLAIWPLVMVVLFQKLPIERALIWSLLIPHLFLPREALFDLPLIPTLDKFSLPAITALVLCLSRAKDKVRILPASRLTALLMIVYVLTPIATVLTNPEPLFYGPGMIPGLRIYDAVSVIMQHMITLIPFILAYNVLSHPQARRDLLAAYVMAGLVYSAPIFVELRLSPQINYWVYGIFPQLFDQQVRFGGYRPVVFLGHSLLVAFFMMMTVLSAAIMIRGSTDRKFYRGAFFFLAIVLVLCKATGAVLFALVVAPLILFAKSRTKSLVALLCATIVLTYPALRGMDAIPVDALTSYAAKIQAERGQSLEFRFNNERRLLAHAEEKPIFGWGFWGRNHLYDTDTGFRSTTTDGYWTIVIGTLGWVGYICVFGMLTLPLFRLYWRGSKTVPPNEAHVVYGLALMLSVKLLDLIPNASVNFMTWMVAAVVLAATTKAAQATSAPQEEQKSPDRSTEPRFSRPPPGSGPLRPSGGRQAANSAFARSNPSDS